MSSSPKPGAEASGGPVTVVTGTSRGIGLHLARHFVEAGHTVLGCSRTAPQWSDARYRHTLLDIRDEAAVTAFFRAVRRDHGRLDNLVNNAGVASMNHALTTPVATVRQVFETNVTAAFLFAREAAKLMMKRRYGRIVNLTSVAVPLRLEGEAAYAASKGALETLTRVLARDLGPLGITVNAIGPGPIETSLIAGVPPERIEALLARLAIPELGTFADVAHVADFFLSPASRMVTGQTVYLGGA